MHFFPALRREVKWSHLLLLYYLNHKFKSSISYSQERVPRTYLESRMVSLIRLSVCFHLRDCITFLSLLPFVYLEGIFLLCLSILVEFCLLILS